MNAVNTIDTSFLYLPENANVMEQIKVFSGNNTQVYDLFEDCIKHFLSLLGYNNFSYQKTNSKKEELSFEDKDRLMKQSLIEEVVRIAGLKDEIRKHPLSEMIHHPCFKWGYSAVLSYFVMLFGKHFYFNASNLEIGQVCGEYFTKHMSEILFEDNVFEKIYEIVSPFLEKPKSKLIKEPLSISRHICEWCGTRYNYNELSNCPSCGA